MRAARLLSAALPLLAVPAHAQTSDAEALFSGKTLTVVVGYEPGGGLPGAASMVAAIRVYSAAPQDGAVIFSPLESTPLTAR